MIYNVVAKLDRIVTKEVALVIEARSEEEAQAKAVEALQAYPGPVTTEGVRRMVTNKSNYWVPKDIEFIKTEKVKEV